MAQAFSSYYQQTYVLSKAMGGRQLVVPVTGFPMVV
jgi:hypothetical protein